MKKFTRILALTLVAVMLTATLASCGAPAKKPADAEAALKEAGYTVITDSTVTPGIFKLAGYELSTMLTATKIAKDDEGNTVTDHVTVYYFADKDAATKAMTKVEEEADKDKEEKNENWVEPKQSGAMIYYGTKAAIKAAK